MVMYENQYKEAGEKKGEGCRVSFRLKRQEKMFRFLYKVKGYGLLSLSN